MSNKVKNILLACLSIFVGFVFFAVYTFGGSGVFGAIAMVFVFGGVYCFVRAFASPNKAQAPNPLYRSPKTPNKKK